MSASHRSISRLPLSLFQDLIPNTNVNFHSKDDNVQIYSNIDETNTIENQNPETIRHWIAKKLRQDLDVLTVGELLNLTPPTLLRSLSPLLTNEHCQEWMQRVYEECSAKPINAFDLYQTFFIEKDNQTHDSNHNNSNDNDPMMTRYLSTAMTSLDKNLNGGIRIGSVTEISGRAGVGKSQLAMQLCIVASKFNQGSIYIDTEQKMSLPRMYEMAHERFLSKSFNDGNNRDSIKKTNDYKSSDVVLQNVIVHKPRSTQEMVSIISNLEEEILIHNEEALEYESSSSLHINENKTSFTKYPIRLIIIDSIAAPTRRDFGSESANERVAAIFQISQTLKRMADQLQIAIVVINQVGLVDENENKNISKTISKTFESTDGSDFVSVAASLGVSWHHCVSTRLLLEHERDPHRQASDIDLAQEAAMSGYQGLHHSSSKRQTWMMERGFVRTVSIVKSNVVGYSIMYFQITKIGVCELEFDENP